MAHEAGWAGNRSESPGLSALGCHLGGRADAHARFLCLLAVALYERRLDVLSYGGLIEYEA